MKTRPGTKALALHDFAAATYPFGRRAKAGAFAVGMVQDQPVVQADTEDES